MAAVVGSVAHISVGIILLLFGLLIVGRRPLWWVHKAEYWFLGAVGIIQTVAPLPILISPSICGSTFACIQRNLIHCFAGVVLLLGIMLSRARKGALEYGIPFAGLMTGYFMMLHDHDISETIEIEIQIEMANLVLHQFAAWMVIVASLLRLACSINATVGAAVEPIFALFISTAGSAFIVTAPDCVDNLIRAFPVVFGGYVIAFLAVLITMVLHLIALVAVGSTSPSVQQPNSHLYESAPTESTESV
jgi:hypothetical protein